MSGDDGATELFNEQCQILGGPGIGGRERRRIAGGTRGARQCDLRVGNQLLVVLESIVVVGPGGRLGDGPGARDNVRVDRPEWERRRVVVGMIRVVVRWFPRVPMPDERAGENRRACRDEMPEP